jgi:hydrogenase-4 component F
MGIVIIIFSLFSSETDYKVANMVQIALILHIVAHSLTKTLLFQTAGNLLLAFRTRAVSVIQGLGVSMEGHAVLWLAGLVFICGMPPSLLFFSELCLVAEAPVWVAVTILVLLFIVFAAMMKVGLSMTMGRPVAAFEQVPKRLTIVPGVLLGLLTVAGILCALGIAA